MLSYNCIIVYLVLRMFKKKKTKILSIIAGLSTATILSIAGVLSGVTYKYNYNRHLETTGEHLVNISNYSSPLPRNAALLPQVSKDGAYFTFGNNSTFTDPKSNDSIYFGELYNLETPSKNIPYGARIINSSLYNNGKNDPIKYFLAGIDSTMYAEDLSSSEDKPPYMPSGFFVYPNVKDNTIINKDSFNSNTQYEISLKNTPYSYSHNQDLSDFRLKSTGIYRPKLGGWPSNFKNTNDLYGVTNWSQYAGASFTNARTFDIKGNPLSDININTTRESWEYFDTTTGGSVIKYNGVFIPKEWEVYDHKKGTSSLYFAEKNVNNFSKLIKFSFANYLNNQSTDAFNINSISITLSAETTNINIAGSRYQKAYPAFHYLNDGNSKIVSAGILNDANYHLFFSGKKDTNFSSSIPTDSKGSWSYDGLYYGNLQAANITFSLTPMQWMWMNPNTKIAEPVLLYAPLPYSGTTKIRIRADVENEDKNFTPIDYVTKTLYAKGSQNDFLPKTDDQADFSVEFINGYPGSEYGSSSKLYLNNVAGTIRWVFDPVTVLKNGLIQKSTNDDIKEITINGFKRIPGVTKIADSINVQSPFTLAQDVVKEPYRYYKLIYDLAIRNLPNPAEFLNGGVGSWTPTTLENLQQVMTVTDVTFNNIGEPTSEGYVNGGYIEANVSLKLYYNEHTNLITPDLNKPSAPKKIRIEGFKHVEPTMVPKKDIYVGDPNITPSQAMEPNYQESVKQSIVDGMSMEVEPTPENDFRTTEGGTLPVTDDSPDFSKKISLINPIPNDLYGSLTVTVVLNQYFADASQNGQLKTSDFKPVEITINGYKQVQETRLNPSITIDTDKTAEEAVNQKFTSGGTNQYPYLQYLLMKYKTDAFVGLPEGFNAGSIQIESVVANNLEGIVSAQVSAFTYYDNTGKLVDLTKPDASNAGLGPKPLGVILIKGFKKVSATKLKTEVISVSNNLEFYNTLASQVNEVKLASLIYNTRNELFTSYPGLYLSVNSIQILDVYKDNLDGSVSISFALTRYYDEKGKYIEADAFKDQWLYFDGKQNPSLKVIGFTQVKPTEFITTKFDASFVPECTESELRPTTISTTNLSSFTNFLNTNNNSNNPIFGGFDNSAPYVIQKDSSNVIQLTNVERSAWEILQLSSKTIFQVSPTDLASFVLRVFQYAGMEKYGINIRTSDIGIKILSNRNPNTIVNSSNLASYENEDWYKGSLEIEITIQLQDGNWNKKISFNGGKEQGKNIFNRYIPIPVYSSSNINDEQKNLATSFSESDIEHFIFQNIDQVLNGSFNSKIPSGKPLNFLNYNMEISNIFYNNNKGEVSVELSIDNFYLPSGNLSIDPSPEVDGENPSKTLKTNIVFTGFKKQKATEFKNQINLVDVNATIPFNYGEVTQGSALWSSFTADKFWSLLTNQVVIDQDYGPQQFIYELIMGTGKLWGGATTPNTERILLNDAEIPTTFSKDDIMSWDVRYSNINGRLELSFGIRNYYDLYGNLESNIIKTVIVEIYGFKSTGSSAIAGAEIDSKDFTNIYINGSYDISASLTTPDYIVENILSKTSGLWPGVDGSEDTNTFDLISKIDPNSIIIVSTNNSKGEVKASFRLLDDVKIYDSEGNEFTLSKNYTYNLIITGFESSLLIFVGISILIIFILFILIPAIIIIIKKARIKSMARGRVSDYLK